jgi:hypothetical protein
MCCRVVWYKFLVFCSAERTESIISAEEYTNQAASNVFLAFCFIGLLLDPEDGGSMFLRNIGTPYRTRESRAPRYAELQVAYPFMALINFQSIGSN